MTELASLIYLPQKEHHTTAAGTEMFFCYGNRMPDSVQEHNWIGR